MHLPLVCAPYRRSGRGPEPSSGGLRIADPLGVRFYCLLFHSGNGRTTERISPSLSAKNGHLIQGGLSRTCLWFARPTEGQGAVPTPQRRFEDSRSFGSPFLLLTIPFRKRTNNRADSLKPERKKWPPHPRWPVSHLPLVCSPYRRSGRGPTPPAEV